MMEVSRWITELQSSVVLEANTNFVKFDIPPQTATDASSCIMNLIQSLNLGESETKTVFTLSCSVIKRMLIKEQQKSGNSDVK